MGLNEAYTVVRGSILMINPFPTMAQTFSILVQEEKQREVKSPSKFTLDSTVIHERGDTSSNFKTNYTPNRNTVGTRKPLNKSNLFCDYCKRTGHIKEKCYKLHGFPPDFKFTKGKNEGTTTIANGFLEEPMRDGCEKSSEAGKCKGKCMNNQDKFLLISNSIT